MLNKTTIMVCCAFFLSAQAMNAQTAPKYGHMNLGNMLELLPATKKANEDLKLFADKLSAKDDSLTKAFQADVTAYQTAYQGGTMTPLQAQTKEAELQKQQESIQKFEQEAQQQVTDERQKLLTPILDMLNEAIKTVAIEHKYAMIFDTSSGSMLYAAETEDVTALVKAKLGL